MNYRIRVASVHTARALYALNWFDIAPGLKYISHDLNLKVIQLGIMTTGFYIGIALFQMVGGAVASRIGNRATATIGMFILGVAGISSGLSGNLTELFISRFLSGLGSALFFSPALGTLSDIVPLNRYSLHVGIYNGSFNVGGGVGVFGFAFIDKMLGWRLGLIIGGVLALAIAAENFIVLKDIKETKSESREILGKMRLVLSSPAIWILPLAGLISILVETLIGQFFVYYAETGLNMAAQTAGAIGGLFLVMGFVGGTIGGYQFGKTQRKILTFFVVLLVTGISVVAMPFVKNTYLLLVILMIMGAMTVDGFSILYIIIVSSVKDRTMISFSLSVVNFIQQSFSIISPILFTTVTYFYGYLTSWSIVGIVGLAATPLLLFISKPSKNGLRKPVPVSFNKQK